MLFCHPQLAHRTQSSFSKVPASIIWRADTYYYIPNIRDFTKRGLYTMSQLRDTGAIYKMWDITLR